jgi:protein SCO1/2
VASKPLRAWALALVGVLAQPAWTSAGETDLPRLGPAPDFQLTDQHRKPASLAQLRGKVVVVNFFFASCKDVCPLQTAKLAQIRTGLGADFGPRVAFVSITLDPAEDSPAALRRHARQHGVEADGWHFLTGTAAAIRGVARSYGVAHRKSGKGDVDHNTLTSLIDSTGTLRVQYMGVEFSPEEMLGDIRGLLQEARPP